MAIEEEFEVEIPDEEADLAMTIQDAIEIIANNPRAGNVDPNVPRP